MKKWIIMLACAALLTLLLPLTMANAAVLPQTRTQRTTETKPSFTPEERAEWKARLQDEWQQLKQLREEQQILRKQIGQKLDALTPLLKDVQSRKDGEKALALVPLQLELQQLRASNRDMRQEMGKLRPGDKAKRKNLAEVEAALQQKIERAKKQTENLKRVLQVVTEMESVLK